MVESHSAWSWQSCKHVQEGVPWHQHLPTWLSQSGEMFLSWLPVSTLCSSVSQALLPLMNTVLWLAYTYLTSTLSSWGHEHPGGQALVSQLLRAAICFHLPCGLEDHAWPMGTAVCPEDVEFCQPVKYVWLFFLPPTPPTSLHSLFILCGLYWTEFLFNRTIYSLYHFLWLDFF